MSLSKRQKELRRSGISASEIAVLAGLSRWSSPIKIYNSKLGFEEELDSYAVDLGTELEEPLAKVYAKRAGVVVARVDTIVHPTRTFAMATPDRAVYASKAEAGDLRKLKVDVTTALRLLEVKSTNWRMRGWWGDAGTDSIPDEYLCQVQWQMGVTGVQSCDVFVDFDKTEGLTFPVAFRPAVFDDLCAIAEAFMIDNVGAGKPPPIDGSEDWERHIERHFPRESNRKAPLQPFELTTGAGEVARALAVLAQSDQAEKRLKALKAWARNVVTAEIGMGTGLAGAWGNVKWLSVKDSAKTDWQAVAREAMNIAGLAIDSLADPEATRVIGGALRELEGKHTVIKPGTRRLTKKFEGPLLVPDDATMGLTLEPVKKSIAAGAPDVPPPGDEDAPPNMSDV